MIKTWIRSQSKETLLKTTKIFIHDNQVFASMEDGFDEMVGEYKSKERAIEVLDEVEKKINLINLGHDFGSPMIDLKNPTYIYQMPNE